jgi:hypothetical protein
MREVDRPSMRVIGLETRTTNAEGAKPEGARIPGLWQRVLLEASLQRAPRAQARRIPPSLTSTRATVPARTRSPWAWRSPRPGASSGATSTT